MKNAFYFMLKALFVLKVFEFLSGLFLSCQKTAWWESWGKFQNLFTQTDKQKNDNIHIALIWQFSYEI